jgi:hypothetical protein
MQKKLYTKWIDIIEWGLQNDAKKMQMWFHLMGFVKACHATRSQQMDVIFLIGFWKLIMRQKKLNAWCAFLKQYFGWFNMLVQWTSPFSFVF